MRNKRYGAAVIVALVIAVAVVASVRKPGGEAVPPMMAALAPGAAAGIPSLVDLGSGSCVSCKMMAPILDGLKKEQAGKVSVTFIDVNQDSEAGGRYGIRVIPTQIFYDAQGNEVFRHEGFFSKEQILGVFKEQGWQFAGG